MTPRVRRTWLPMRAESRSRTRQVPVVEWLSPSSKLVSARQASSALNSNTAERRHLERERAGLA